MKTKYILCLLFSLWYVIGFSQIVLPEFIPIIDEKEFEILKTDSTPDSTFVLKITNCVLDSIIKDKISYFKTTFKVSNHFKNIDVSFQSNRLYDYIRITGNIPKSDITNSKSLIGVIIVDDFRLCIYNCTELSIDNYFQRTALKYFVPKHNDKNTIIMTINTPTWFYVLQNGNFIEVKPIEK